MYGNVKEKKGMMSKKDIISMMPDSRMNKMMGISSTLKKFHEESDKLSKQTQSQSDDLISNLKRRRREKMRKNSK